MSERLPEQVHRLPARVRLAAAIESLPETERLVLSLRLLEGLSPIEAAGALKLEVREVELHMNSAMEVLCQDMGVRAPLRRAA